MNNIKKIEKLSRDELEAGVLNYQASWHWDYHHTAFVYFGGIPLNLTEGDVLTIFSQYGNPVYVKLVRDKDTGKSKGFGFLKYADQRSTVLAVDNLNGTEILGRRLRVDHSEFDLKNEDEQDFDAVCRTVLEATNNYDGEEVGAGGHLDDGIERIEEGSKHALSDRQRDKQEKDELDPMAKYLSSKPL